MKDKKQQLEDEVQYIIDRNPHLGRRKLRCQTTEGHVVLTGEVQSFYQKQMAQESLKNVGGIVSIENCLEVVSS